METRLGEPTWKKTPWDWKWDGKNIWVWQHLKNNNWYTPEIWHGYPKWWWQFLVSMLDFWGVFFLVGVFTRSLYLTSCGSILASQVRGESRFPTIFIDDLCLKQPLTIPSPPTNPWLIWILSMAFLAFGTESSLIKHTSDLQVNHFNPRLQVTVDKRKLFHKNIFNLNPLWLKGGSHNLTCDRCSLPGLCCYRHRGKDGGIRGWGWVKCGKRSLKDRINPSSMWFVTPVQVRGIFPKTVKKYFREKVGEILWINPWDPWTLPVIKEMLL